MPRCLFFVISVCSDDRRPDGVHPVSEVLRPRDVRPVLRRDVRRVLHPQVLRRDVRPVLHPQVLRRDVRPVLRPVCVSGYG